MELPTEWAERLNNGRSELCIIQCKRALTGAEKQMIRDWWKAGGHRDLFPRILERTPFQSLPSDESPTDYLARIIARMDWHIARLRRMA